MARTFLVTALTALTIGTGALATSAPAEASGWKPFPAQPWAAKPAPHKPGPTFGPKYGHGYGGGLMAAGVIGGLALGAVAASAEEGECYVSRREFMTEDGDIVIRRLRVCE